LEHDRIEKSRIFFILYNDLGKPVSVLIRKTYQFSWVFELPSDAARSGDLMRGFAAALEDQRDFPDDGPACRQPFTLTLGLDKLPHLLRLALWQDAQPIRFEARGAT
jgi:hypothetical protein